MSAQDATNTRAAARMVVLANDAADVLEVLGLLPGQAIDAPRHLSSGFHDPTTSVARAGFVAWRLGRAS